MVILHIAALDGDKCSGVSVVVPKHIIAQQKYAEVGLVNVLDAKIDGVANIFHFNSNFNIDDLTKPFNKPNIIIFHEMYRTQYLTIYKQAVEKNIPYIIVPHGGLSVEAQNKKRIKKLIANMLFFNSFFNKAKALHCLSEREKNNLSINKKLFICPNGVDVPVDKKECFSCKSFKLVYIGRLETKIKGIDLLMSAVGQMADTFRINNISLYIYGPEYSNEKQYIRDAIEKYNISDIVSINDAVFDEDKKNVLLSADCFIQTSRTEGLPTGLMEAISYALPVIVTEGTGLAEDVRKYDMGYACETTASGIKNAFNEFINTSDKLNIKGQNGRNYIINRMTWDMVATKELAEYKSIIN